MSKSGKRFAAILVLLTLGLSSGNQPAAAQNMPPQGSKVPAEQIATVDEETYEKVLDLVFPREILKDFKARFVFVLRYEPTFRPESQIVVVGRNDRIEVTTYSSLDGSIERKLTDMVRQGIPQVPEQVAKEIRIQTRPLKSSRVLSRKYHRDFLEALRLSERVLLTPAPDTIAITADGTTYRLWYSGVSQINCELAGSDISTPTGPHEPPLMKWMKDMSRMFLPSANHTSNR